jgi:hypothetical protein
MPFLPPMHQTCTRQTGPKGTPPLTTIFTNEPCGYWLSSGREKNRAVQSEPIIIGQVAFSLARQFAVTCWSGYPPVFNPAAADRLTISSPGGITVVVLAVHTGPMWVGEPEEHFRVNVTQGVLTAPVTAPSINSGRLDGRSVTFNILRPFGGATFASGVLGTLYADLQPGRGGYSGGNYFPWTDYLECSDSTDIRDGCTRPAGIDAVSFSNGDEVLITTPPTATAYVVVQVQRLVDLNGVTYKRAYLTRDQAGWPGP